jgi:hypothetical protein
MLKLVLIMTLSLFAPIVLADPCGWSDVDLAESCLNIIKKDSCPEAFQKNQQCTNKEISSGVLACMHDTAPTCVECIKKVLTQKGYNLQKDEPNIREECVSLF